jgi:two-component system, response regulator PdtaR
MAEPMAEHDVLHGLNVLVVEDETFIALEIEQILVSAGCCVLGPIATVRDALALLEDARPRAALLDVQLLNGMITPVAERLQALGISFVLVSAYTGPELHTPVLANAPRVDKPVSPPRLLAALANAVQALGPVGASSV